MPHAEPIHYDEAGDDLRALYDDICARRGLSEVPNWAVHLGHAPHVLSGLWSMIKTTFDYRLPPLLTQLILFAVSRENSCSYCTQYHGTMVLQLDSNLAYHDLLEICDGTSRALIPDRYQVALKVALNQLRRQCSLPEDEMGRLVEAGFSERERLEIMATISLALLLNAYTTTMDIPIDSSHQIEGFTI